MFNSRWQLAENFLPDEQPQQQRADVTTADAMMKIGEDEQQQSQAALNLDYQDFLNDRDAPMQNALTFNQALRAMPTPTSSPRCCDSKGCQPGIASRPAPSVSSAVNQNTMLSVVSVRDSRRNETTAIE